jgi:membrane-associated phospholipid phosphatase
MTLLVAAFLSGPALAGSNWQERADSVSRSRLSERSAASARAEIPASQFHEIPRFSLAAAQDADAAAGNDSVSQSQPAEEQAAKAEVERGPLPGFGETVRRDLEALPRVLWHDTKAAFGNPWNLVVLASAGGASIALRTTNADAHVDEYYRDRHTFDGDWPDTFGALGNPGLHFALAGVWYVAGQTLQDDKTYEVGRKLFNALTITGVSTMFLKVCAWDDAPNGEWGAWPSGHVSSTMAVATVLNGAYGPLVGVPMFGLTGLVAVERMDDREHWLSDVVFGAVLGWVVGETVFKEHRPEILGGEVVPYVDPERGGAGVAWVKPLGLHAPPTAASR